jgi:hypothetical protein
MWKKKLKYGVRKSAEVRKSERLGVEKESLQLPVGSLQVDKQVLLTANLQLPTEREGARKAVKWQGWVSGGPCA